MTEEIDPEDVSEDSRLTPPEKETIVQFTKDDDRINIFTQEGGLMYRLLNHPEFSVNDSRCVERDGNVVGVDGTLPVECLTMKVGPRKDSGHSRIISNGVFD